MDGRAFGSGFSSWRGGSSSRGSGDYDLYGSKDSGRGGYGAGGYGGGGGHMNRHLSETTSSSSSSFFSSRTSTEDLISKINQKLDMLTQLHGRGRVDRFNQYESVDSSSSALGPRDLYRSGNYGYGDSRGGMMAQRGGMGFGPMGGPGDGGDFERSTSYRSAKMWQGRDAFSGSGWGAEQRSPRRGGAPGGYSFGGRQDSFSVGSGGGRNGGQDKLPSLLAHRMYHKSGAFQPQRGTSQDYPDRHFEGGRRANRQRSRKQPLKQQVKPQQSRQKKRKHSETADDEPDPKMDKTETAGGPAKQKDGTKEGGGSTTASETAAEGKSSVLSIEEELAQLKEKLHKKRAPSSAKSDSGAADQTEESKQDGASTMQDSTPEAEGQSSALSIEEELSQLKAKQQETSTEMKPKKRRFFFEMSGVKITARRISFVCSVCKFRSFYSEDLAAHLESQFHKDVFRFLSSRLSERTMDFLQEYLHIKHKNMENTVSKITNHSAAICQLYKEQDFTRDIEMEHFVKKVEAAHCAACDLYFPMQSSLIQKHLRSPDHNYNRKRMMEESKKAGLTVARSILNHKPVQQKLERYLKGEDPFTDDQDLEDSMVTGAPEANLTNEIPEVKQEEAEPAGVFPAEESLGKQMKPEEHKEHEEPKIKQEEGVEAEELEVKQEIKEEEVEEGGV